MEFSRFLFAQRQIPVYASVWLALLACLLIPCPSLAQSSGWTPQQSGVSQNLQAVYVLNSNLGWVVGDAGTILRTETGGEIWISVPSPVSHNLRNVFFVDALHGWIVGEGGTILQSEDSGRSWRRQQSGLTEDAWILDVFFTDSFLGWAASNRTDGQILTTSNGGQNWSVRTVLPGYDFFLAYQIEWWDLDRGWIAPWGGRPNGGMLATQNGGESWVHQPTDGVYYMMGVSFVSPLEGWAVGYTYSSDCLPGYVFHTVDGGSQWSQIASQCNLTGGIKFIDESQGWIANGEDIYATIDGGHNWQTVYAGAPFHDFHRLDAENGWIVQDGGGILRRTGVPSAYTLYGHIVSESGQPLAGVQVTANTGEIAVTNPSGEFTFPNLRADAYSLTPQLDGYTFTPASISRIVPPARTDLGFTGRSSGSSSVTPPVPIPEPGIVVLFGAGLASLAGLAKRRHLHKKEKESP